MPYLLRRVLEVREILEDYSSQAIKETPKITEAYGKSLYKCPMLRCTRFFRGFATRLQRDEHLKGHQRNHKCLEKYCDYSELGFASEGELTKHIQLCHSMSTGEFVFPNVRRVSTSKTLRDAIDRDNALAIRDLCDPATVKTIRETGFLLRAIRRKRFNAAMVVMELLGTPSEVGHEDGNGTTALHEAVVEVGFEHLLQEMLKTDVDFQKRNIHGETPLSKALKGGHFHAVRLLLSIDGIDPNSCPPSVLRSGTQLAAAEGKDDILQYIFPVTVNVTPDQQLSKWISVVIDSAASHRHESTLFVILKLSRDLGIEKHYKAIPEGELHIVMKLIIERSVDSENMVDRKVKNLNVELKRAAKRGDAVTVMDLLRSGADINHRTNGKLPTALAAASSENQLSVMKLLLDEGAEVDARGRSWITALGAAASKGKIEAIQLLLENGAKADDAMYSASSNGHTAFVKSLIEKEVNINAHGDGGDALNVACSGGHDSTVQLLLKNRAGIYTRGEIADIEFGEAWSGEQEKYLNLCTSWSPEQYKYFTPRNFSGDGEERGLNFALYSACQKGQLSIVKLLLERIGRPVNVEGLCTGKYHRALFAACQLHGEDGLKIAQMLLQNGADLNHQKGRLLRGACCGGNLDVVKELLKRGVDVNGSEHENCYTALNLALRHRHENIVRLLLEKGAEPKGGKESALYSACDGGNPDLVKVLLEHKADVNGRSYDQTALYQAVCSNQERTVQLLLEHGAEVNALNYGGRETALYVASRRGYTAIVQLLLQSGAIVKITGLRWHGEGSALSGACDSRENVATVRVLLENGADVNGNSGLALMNAIQSGGEEMVQLLREYGAREM